MEYQEQLYSDWRSSGAKVFWGIVFTSVSSVFSYFYDIVSWIGILVEMIAEHSKTGESSIYNSKFFLIGVGAKILIIVGYVLYIVGLTQFAKIQQKESTAHYVYKARTSVILLIITCVISLVFGFISVIPLIGVFFLFIVWLMYVITYFIMKHAYDGMMMADDFGGRAKLGAKNVRYAAVCQLRLLFLPLVILLVALLYFLLAGASIYGMREEIAKMAVHSSNMLESGAVMIIVPAVILVLLAIICAIIWGICAFIWPMMGWYRIMTDGPADVMILVHQNQVNDESMIGVKTPVQEINIIRSSDSEISLPVSDVHSLKDNSEGEENPKRKWYFIGGAAAAIIVLISIVIVRGCCGEFAGKSISELFPQVEKANDSGMIPDSPTIYEWDVSQGEECDGDVTVVRKADENQLVIMYETNSCDANILRLGVYQNGQYVFYYELPVGSLEYDETRNGLSLHPDLPESIIYYGYYGKDMAKSVEKEWGTEHPLDWNKVSESLLADIFKKALNDGPNDTPFILTYNEIMANMGGVSISENEEEKGLSGYTFLVGNAEFGLDLYIDVDGNKIPTGISGTAETLDIFHQYDFDGDGEKEALISEWGGGNALYPPYIVYYDKDSKLFKKAEGFETIFSENDVELEYWEGKQSMLVKAGLETSRYIYENHQVKKVESKTADLGPELMTITCEKLFGNESEDECKVEFDLNDDGQNDTLVFTHNDSHAYDYGNAMMLKKIIWSTGTETFGCHQIAIRYTFLKSMTAGVHDIVTDGRRLQKWNGEKYGE